MIALKITLAIILFDIAFVACLYLRQRGQERLQARVAANNLDQLSRGRAELRALCGDFETMFYDWEVLAFMKRGQLGGNGDPYAALIGPAALKFDATHEHGVARG